MSADASTLAKLSPDYVRRISPYVPGKRYVDWELDDPSGQPIETVREVRDEIARRVNLLLADMGAGRGGLA